jgi:hypothetical protein
MDMDSTTTATFLRDLTAWASDETFTAIVGIDEAGPLRIALYGHSDQERLVEGALAAASTWEGEGRNVYYSAAALRDGIPAGSRGTAADVRAMLAIVVDLDDPEAAATWPDRARACGLWPSHVVMSSSRPTPRFQLVYLLKEPCEDLSAWRAAARRVECWFGADWCSKDPAHVWRLPGTMNFPNAKKRRAGRVPERSILVETDGEVRRHDLGDFDALPEGTAPAGADVDVAAAAAAMPPTAAWAHAGQIMEHLPDWLQAEMCAGVPEDRSRLDTRIAKECIRAGVGLGDYLELYRLAARDREGFTDKYRERIHRQSPAAAEEYLARTYERGRAAILAAEGAVPDVRSFGVSADETEVDSGEPRWVKFIRRSADFLGQPYPEVLYWASPWLPKESIVLVHGKAGHGKSRILLHWCYSMTTGRSVPGSDVSGQEVRPRVLYLDGEQSRRTVQSTLMELREEYGDDEGRFMILPASFFEGDTPNFNKADHKLEFLRAARAVNADVLVIDNVRSLYPGMVENDAQAWADINGMVRWYRDQGFTVIWVHHDRKAAGDSPDMAFAGSSHAITATELQIHVQAYSKEDRKQIAGKLDDVVWRLKNAVTVKFHKNRNGDDETQRDIAVAFLERTDKRAVALRMLDGTETTPTVAPAVLNLPPAEIAYAISKGWVPGVAKTKKNAEIAGIIKGLGVASPQRQNIPHWIKSVEARMDGAEERRIKSLCVGGVPHDFQMPPDDDDDDEN